MNIPPATELSAIAARLGFSLSPAEADIYRQALVMVADNFAELPDGGDTPLIHDGARPSVPSPPPAENPFNAYITRCFIEGAAEGPLSGTRVGLKDHISVAGIPLTLGSRFMEEYVPNIDATVVTRLLDAGAAIVGKLNMDGFSRTGHGGGTGIGDYGRCPNPFAPDHLSGGSSSGCAVAVACGEVDLAIGGDQGGSIRIPAAWCGIAGLKPTYGLVPHTGVLGIEPSLDHVGPMARTVELVGRTLEAIAGPDGHDPRQTVTPPRTSYVEEMQRGVASLRIGVLRESFGDAIEPDVEASVREAADHLASQGASVREISIPTHLDGDRVLLALQVMGTDLFVRTGGGAFLRGFYDTHFIEAFGRRLGTRIDLLPPTLKLCILSGAVLGIWGFRQYGAAQNVRTRLHQAYDQAFREVDCLLMPTVPVKAPKYAPPRDADEALQRALLRKLARVVTQNTAQFDLTGHPALTFPCGMTSRLPIGIQLVGPYFSDGVLLRIGHTFEQTADWNHGVGPEAWHPESGRDSQVSDEA